MYKLDILVYKYRYILFSQNFVQEWELPTLSFDLCTPQDHDQIWVTPPPSTPWTEHHLPLQ